MFHISLTKHKKDIHTNTLEHIHKNISGNLCVWGLQVTPFFTYNKRFTFKIKRKAFKYFILQGQNTQMKGKKLLWVIEDAAQF